MPRRSANRPTDHASLREAILEAAAQLWSDGLIIATEGNLSVRLDAGTLLITPATRRKWELEPDELVVVEVAPDAPPGGASSDIRIHRAVYAARPDVTAVVHAHVPAAMGLTLAGVTPDPAVLPETAIFLPRLPVVPFEAAGSTALAAAVGAALAEEPAPLPGAVLLERHGAVAVGVGAGEGAVAQAVDRLQLVEVLCRTWRDALLLRAATVTLAAAPGEERRAILRPTGPEPARPARGRTT